jgi:hypothetical protein
MLAAVASNTGAPRQDQEARERPSPPGSVSPNSASLIARDDRQPGEPDAAAIANDATGGSSGPAAASAVEWCPGLVAMDDHGAKGRASAPTGWRSGDTSPPRAALRAWGPSPSPSAPTLAMSVAKAVAAVLAGSAALFAETTPVRQLRREATSRGVSFPAARLLDHRHGGRGRLLREFRLRCSVTRLLSPDSDCTSCWALPRPMRRPGS